MPGRELVLATRNDHKVAEVTRLLAPFDLSVIPLPPAVNLPPEDGESYAANALIKARAGSRVLGRAVIADDSGIEAAALGGAPGIRSARYAGEHATDKQNLEKLLREVPPGDALAYVCALAYVDPQEGVEQMFVGSCGGSLDPRPRGERGFGYDPVFLPDDGPPGLTMAELSDDQKDAISHRGKAARALLQWLEQSAVPTAG